jgi:hypothetical protein
LHFRSTAVSARFTKISGKKHSDCWCQCRFC